MGRNEQDDDQKERVLQERLITTAELLDQTLRSLATVPELAAVLIGSYLHRFVLGYHNQTITNPFNGSALRFTHEGATYTLEYSSTPTDTRLYLQKGLKRTGPGDPIESITITLSHEGGLHPQNVGIFHWWLQTYNHRSDRSHFNSDQAKLAILTFLETNFPQD